MKFVTALSRKEIRHHPCPLHLPIVSNPDAAGEDSLSTTFDEDEILEMMEVEVEAFRTTNSLPADPTDWKLVDGAVADCNKKYQCCQWHLRWRETYKDALTGVHQNEPTKVATRPLPSRNTQNGG